MPIIFCSEAYFFQAWGSLMSLKSQTRDTQLKVPPGGIVLRIFMSWKKNPLTSVTFEPANLGSWGEHVAPRLTQRLLLNNCILMKVHFMNKSSILFEQYTFIQACYLRTYLSQVIKSLHNSSLCGRNHHLHILAVSSKVHFPMTKFQILFHYFIVVLI